MDNCPTRTQKYLSILALGSLVISASSTYDERSDLINRMKEKMARQDTVKEDARDLRDKIISTREQALLLKDLKLNEYAYDGGIVSIGPEKNGSDICIFISIGNYTEAKKITLDSAREYLKK
jgi:hypothetical protein